MTNTDALNNKNTTESEVLMMDLEFQIKDFHQDV